MTSETPKKKSAATLFGDDPIVAEAASGEGDLTGVMIDTAEPLRRPMPLDGPAPDAEPSMLEGGTVLAITVAFSVGCVGLIYLLVSNFVSP